MTLPLSASSMRMLPPWGVDVAEESRGRGWNRGSWLRMPPVEARERRAKLLASGGNGWHVIEVAIAVGAGIAAGSVALVGFGIDSVIEALASGVIVWLFSGGRGSSHTAERPRSSAGAALMLFALRRGLVLTLLLAGAAGVLTALAGAASALRRQLRRVPIDDDHDPISSPQ